MIKWAIKKYIMGKVNGLLERYNDNVDVVRDKLKVWIARLDKILFAFRSLLEKLDDNKIDDEEIDQTLADVEIVIKNW